MTTRAPNSSRSVRIRAGPSPASAPVTRVFVRMCAPFDSVLVAASLQVLKYGELIFAVADDQLASAFVRDVVSGAEFVEHRRAAHAMERLERPRLVVDPGVDDSAVARRSPHAQTRRRFEQEHVVVVEGDFGGDGCSDDSAANDGYVSDVRYAHCVIQLCGKLNRSTLVAFPVSSSTSTISPFSLISPSQGSNIVDRPRKNLSRTISVCIPITPSCGPTIPRSVM